MKIKSMRNCKKVLIVCTVSILTLFICIAVYAQNENRSKDFGMQQAKILSSTDDSAVASIDGEKITKKGFETYKLFVNSGEKKLSDSEILDKIIERQIIYKKAQIEGITITDDEVTNLINTSKNNYKSSNEQYLLFQDYIKGLNMTEDQYWESVRPAYKNFLIMGKFKNSLKEKYAKENNISNKTELDKKFNSFYDQYLKDLKSKTKIQYNN